MGKLLNMGKFKAVDLGKAFLLFLPDSQSAYYNSFVSVFGRSLPPSLGPLKICCTCDLQKEN